MASMRSFRIATTAGLVFALAVAVGAVRSSHAQDATSRPAADGIATSRPGDWPQWRGPTRDGISTETTWRTDWAATPPKELWKAQVGAGYSAVAVANGKLYTMGNKDGKDIVWCLDAEKGTVIWQQSYPCKSPAQYPGPRATPTVDGKFVYTLSREGRVMCWDADSGQGVWSRTVARELKAESPGWGYASSPLVVGKLVIVNVGAAGAALDKAKGDVVWQSGGGKGSYASPVPLDYKGQQCVAIFSGKSLVVVNAATGKKVWEFPWQTGYDVNAADPIIVGDKVFITTGYKHGSALLSAGADKPVWESKSMQAQAASPVLFEGFLYGSNGDCGRGDLVCLDAKDGTQKWKASDVGAIGGLILADGKLIVQSGGEVVVVEAAPGQCKAVARAKVLSGTCWTNPVLSGGRIYCRNLEGDLVCLDVKK